MNHAKPVLLKTYTATFQSDGFCWPSNGCSRKAKRNFQTPSPPFLYTVSNLDLRGFRVPPGYVCKARGKSTFTNPPHPSTTSWRFLYLRRREEATQQALLVGPVAAFVHGLHEGHVVVLLVRRLDRLERPARGKSRMPRKKVENVME